MRRIAIINQKGGVGKTTTTANLGAALAIQGRRVVVVDMDAQANLSLSLGIEARSGAPTSYTVLTGATKFAAAIRPTSVPRLSIVPTNIDLSGAELELASAMGREFILRDAVREWVEAEKQRTGVTPADYLLFDCPPSLGLLSINALATASEVLITLQTEFLALQGMSKLVEVVQLLKKRLNPELVVTGILPCLYDSRLRLAREVLGEIRTYFQGQVFPYPVRSNVKLAEAPSFGQTVFEYAPDSNGAEDYMRLAREVLAREGRDAELADLPTFDENARLAPKEVPVPRRPPPRPPPRKPAVVSAPSASAPSVTAPSTSAPSVTTPSVTPSRVKTSHVPASNTPAASAPATNAPATSAPTPGAKPTVAVPAAPAPSATTRVPASAETRPAVTPSAMKTPVTPLTQTSAPTTSNAASSPGKPPSKNSAAVHSTPATTSGKSPAMAEPTATPRAIEKPRAPSPKGDDTANTETRKFSTNAASARIAAEPRILRAEDVPPLPPDAFEILSILPTDS